MSMALVSATPKARKPPSALPGRREVEQLFLGALDLLGRAVVEILAEGVVDDVLADHDQLAAQVKVVDVAAVILGIDDR